MAGPKYLLCPQCGVARFFIVDEQGDKVYFHVDFSGTPFPTETSAADLAGRDFSAVHCCGCSWVGTLRKLVKYI